MSTSANKTNHPSRRSEADTARLYFGPKPDARGEWWYYNGHLRAGDHQYAFHAAFFRFRTAGYRIGRFVPLSWFSQNVQFAHVSLTCYQQQTTWFSQRRVLDRTREQSSDTIAVRVGNWSLLSEHDQHQLRVNGSEFDLSLEMDPIKPFVCYETSKPESMDRDAMHISCPRMTARGSIETPHGSRDVVGEVWMDREYGEVGLDHRVGGWVWISIQFDHGEEMMIYRTICRVTGQIHLRVALVNESGEAEMLNSAEVRMLPLRSWRSSLTDGEYPVSWRLSIPGRRMEVELHGLHDAMEFDTRGTTDTLYWEGPARVAGVKNRQQVEGNAFIEIAGHGKRRLIGQLDHQTKQISTLGYFGNELRYFLLGAADQKLRHRFDDDTTKTKDCRTRFD